MKAPDKNGVIYTVPPCGAITNAIDLMRSQCAAQKCDVGTTVWS